MSEVNENLGSSPKVVNPDIQHYLMKEWGGPENFAKDMVQTFHDAPPGSVVRTNILWQVLSVLKGN
jgi:hypothetical protein